MSDDLESMAVFLGEELVNVLVREPVRKDAGRMLGRYHMTITGSGGVPVLTGRLRGSQTPFAGELPPPGPDENAPFYAIHGEDEVDRVVAAWDVGNEPLGDVSQLPYSAPIMADGHSAKFPEGRLDAIIADAVEGGD